MQDATERPAEVPASGVTGGDTPPTRDDAVAAGAGAVVVLASLTLPWITTRLGGTPTRFAGWELRATTVGVVLLVVAAAGAVLVARRTGRSVVQVAAVLSAGTLTFGLLAVAVAAELLAVWLTPDMVPSSLRRLTVGAGPAVGMWVALLASAALLVATGGRTRQAATVASGTIGRLRRSEPAAIGAVLALLGAALFAVSRYGVWVVLESSAGDWRVPGWGLPWFGVLGLAALFVVVPVGAAALRWPALGPGVLLTTAGWVMSLLAASVLVVDAAVGRFTAPGWLVDRLADVRERADAATADTPLAGRIEAVDLPGELSVDLLTGWGAPVAFLSGVVVAAGGALVTVHATSAAAGNAATSDPGPEPLPPAGAAG